MDNGQLLNQILNQPQFRVGDNVSWPGRDGKPRYGRIDAVHKSAANTVRVMARNHNAYWKRTADLTLVTHA